MTVHSLEEAIKTKIERVLPDVLGVVDGPHHFQYYVGNGKDGTVFRMFNPDDPDDRSLDGYVVKVWDKGFRLQEQELEVHAAAAALPAKRFRVPRIVHVDPLRTCFVMERARGEEAFKAVFRRKRFIDESVLASIQEGFRELNEFGIIHNDAHTLNYLLDDLTLTTTADGSCITDASLWIIDFGRSRFGEGTQDIRSVTRDLSSKLVP